MWSIGFRKFKLSPEDLPDIDLHASEIKGGRKRWRKFAKETREQVFEGILRLVAEHARHDRLRLFCAVLEKEALIERIFAANSDHNENLDVVEYAYEQLCTRFDMFLRRRYITRNEMQRGLIIVDKSRYEQMLQTLAHEYRVGGTRWGRLRNLVEVPVFVIHELLAFCSSPTWSLMHCGAATNTGNLT